MTEEEKKAIKLIYIKKRGIPPNGAFIIENELVDTILNLIQKQDTEINKLNNIIDRMAEEYSLEANTDILDICACCNYNNEDCHGDYCKEALINYFTNKVEEDK